MVEVAAAGADARRRTGTPSPASPSTSTPAASWPAASELPENISLMSAGAVSGLIFDELLAGRAAELQTGSPT